MNFFADITPATQIAVPLSVIVAILVGMGATLISIGVAVFKGAWYLRGILAQLEELNKRVKSSWTRQEHERWAHRLERENAEIGLRVPAVETESNH